MINVRFNFIKNSLSVNGHSGYAEIGQDIVCSAASILSYTLGQTIMEMFREHKLKEKPTIEIVDGNAEITCKPKEQYLSDVWQLFKYTETGFRLLENTYPKHVRLIGESESS